MARLAILLLRETGAQQLHALWGWGFGTQASVLERGASLAASESDCDGVCVNVCVRVCAHIRACVCACVRVCVRSCVRACMQVWFVPARSCACAYARRVLCV